VQRNVMAIHPGVTSERLKKRWAALDEDCAWKNHQGDGIEPIALKIG
jgi:hypothetical protein